jgi:TRAP-type transport system periplasmic protein
MRVWLLLAVLLVWPVRSAAADPRDPVRLRLGTLAIDGSRYMKDILALGKEIKKRTRGAVVLDWVAGGQLGEEAAMAELVAAGKLDGGGFSETGLVALVPDMAVWRTPALFRSYEDVDRATAALDPTIRELFANRDLVFGMWADLGFAHIFSIDPINTLNEAITKAAPFLAATLDGTLVEAIGTARARAWAVPPLYQLALPASKARYMTNLRYRYVVGGLVFSRAAWSRIPAAEQTIILATCREWQAKIRTSWRKETERGLAALEKSGIALRGASEAQLTAFLDGLAASTTAGSELHTKIVSAIATR